MFSLLSLIPKSHNRPRTQLAREECYRALVYMPLYTFLHNLLNVLVQIANKMGMQKKKKKDMMLHQLLGIVWL
jgi:hypothetical protein